MCGFSAVQWEAASQKQQKKKKIKKEERKPSRHWDTQKGGAQHDNQLTLKEANTEV